MGFKWWITSELYSVSNMTKAELDISFNRKISKYSRKDMLRRLLWGLCKPFFSIESQSVVSLAVHSLKDFWRKNWKECSYLQLKYNIHALES